MGLLEKLGYTSHAIDDIQKAIIEKGVAVPAHVELAHYGDKIRAINTDAPPIVLDGTATPDQVLEGVAFYSDDPNVKQIGAMAMNNDMDKTLTEGEIFAIPKGYHSGNSVVRGPEGGMGGLKWYRTANLSFTEKTTIDGKTAKEMIGHIPLIRSQTEHTVTALNTIEMIIVQMRYQVGMYVGGDVTFAIGLWEKWKNFASWDYYSSDFQWTAEIMDLSNITDHLLPIRFTYENKTELTTPKLELEHFRIKQVAALFR